ncbi:P-loop containing nucleoside triphosphate hydrolase protein [Ustulina deusta]|nr:P-loop containing nucleoside triphosphate hydrolase protein [Ustulina deusta]
MQSRNDTVIFVLGPPGSGKGTLCKHVTEMLTLTHRCYRHLSVGDYLRELCDPKTPRDAQGFDHSMIRDYLREGKLLPADVLTPVLKHKIDSTPNENGSTVWLIDGFPRNMETALAFEEQIGQPVRVITLQCDRNTAQRRFLSRGREQTDDERRFNKRYDEYVENMGAIRNRYAGIMESISVDGDQGQCLHHFMGALPPTSSD